MARESFAIGNVRVRAGASRDVELPITRLVTGGDASLPVRVVHGREDGPVVWVSGAIHGDEVIGVEVIRELIATLSPKEFQGTLVAVPVVNVLGFMAGDRYLPDRRDLNRMFPGSPRGSLASRIAHLFMTEVVKKCDVGIDVHTAADKRANLPQIRADLDDPRTRELAEAFGAPVMVHARVRDGSLRQAAVEVGAKVLLYEAGEALRFDDESIATGVAGVRRVLAFLEHDRARPRRRAADQPGVAQQPLGPRAGHGHPQPRHQARRLRRDGRPARRALGHVRPAGAAGQGRPGRHRHRHSPGRRSSTPATRSCTSPPSSPAC